MKEEKDAAKEAFDTTAPTQFLFGPGGRQARAVLLPLGFQGMTATACNVVWIQAMRRSPQNETYGYKPKSKRNAA